MTEKLHEALEVCIQALETGADIESVLKRYPHLADELRPLLETVIRAQSLASPSISEKTMQRGRARVLQYAAEMRESADKPKKAGALFTKIAVSLALIWVFFLGGTSLVRASSSALPGDDLYPVKRTWEDVRLLLVFDDDSRIALEDKIENERLGEVFELLLEGRDETISFTGMVTEMDGDWWQVSGLTVLIDADSELPVEPVVVGDLVEVDGHTHGQGFVEAERIGLLEAGDSVPVPVPDEIEEFESFEDNTSNENENLSGDDDHQSDNSNDGNSGSNDSGDHSNDNDDDSADRNSNDNSNDNEPDEDNSNENDNDDEPDEDNSNDNSNDDDPDEDNSNDNDNDD